MKKNIVIINEQHSLLPSQTEALERENIPYELYKIPVNSLNIVAQTLLANKLEEMEDINVIFASPIPLLLAQLSYNRKVRVGIFHNDNRKKKELPNGKITFTIPDKGWQIVWIGEVI